MITERWKRQHPCTQEFDAGAAVHGPLERLEAVDLSLCLAVAPRLGDRLADRGETLPQRGCELPRRMDAGAGGVAQPTLQRRWIAALGRLRKRITS